MVGAFLDEQAKPVCAESGTAEDRRKFADVVNHASVFLWPAGFGCTSAQENSLGPTLGFAALANHLPIRRPKRGAFQQQSTDRAWPCRSRVKRNQCAKRRASQPRILWARRNTIVARNEWHHFFHQKMRIALALHAQHHWLQRAMRHVFAKAVFAGIVDADDNHRRDDSFPYEAIRSFVDTPFNPGEGSRWLEQVLAVIQIKNRIAAARIFLVVIAGRKPDSQKAGVTESPALKLV